MDATKKGKICVVALIHFLATISIFFIGMMGPSGNWFGISDFPHLWQKFWFQIGTIVQPQIALFPYLSISDPPPPEVYISASQKFLLPAEFIAFLVSIPIWSLCFGWLFVKFDNWLNRFPVLGRRVF